ncbi:MAG: transcription-repair coupling factor [Actinomycetota bacterium]
MHGLVARLGSGYPFAKLHSSRLNSRLEIVSPSAANSAILALFATLAKENFQLVIVPTGREAEELESELRYLVPGAEILQFPAWETLPHERLSPSAEIVGARLKTLHRVKQLKDASWDHPVFLIASIRAVLQRIISGLENYPPLRLKRGVDYLLPELTLKLVEQAYQRVDMVSRRGEFAIRGGILDIFPTTSEHAIRLEFFGDELEEIREFSVSDQRSSSIKLEELVIYPARELIITPDVSARAREMMHEFPALSEMLQKIAVGIPIEGMESLAPALTPAMVSLFDYLPNDMSVAMVSPEKSAARAVNLVETNEEFLHAAWDAAMEGASAPIDLSGGGFIEFSEMNSKLKNYQFLSLSPFGSDTESIINLQLLEVPSFRVLETKAVDYIADQLAHEQIVGITGAGMGTLERLREQLSAEAIDTRIVSEFPADPKPKTLYLFQSPLRKGFVSQDSQLSILTDSEFYGKSSGYQSPQAKKLAVKRGQAVDPLTLKAGDYVVHEIHGIGRFRELVQRQSGIGTRSHQREYLLIEYAPPKRGYPEDTLFVPTDQLDLLTRYVGGEAPVVSKLGGSDWARAKGNARKAVRKIAIDLVKLYSQRVNSQGYAFGPDTPWQHELEEAFAYQETPDQLTTIDEVKRDMEKPIPMDRLLAGDVGYGKTEVAIRAAFKAIQDGKQVAMLVPTTLLVRQHTDTFLERFSGFPVNVRSLSRFQSPKEVKETLAGLASGAVDLVIGTHRLLSDSVKFRNLGLIIIDEEQRFGVEHKEKLKALKTNVDILAMSATPIPRTLEMAITGIREMSTLATPPEDRHPILTYIGGYSEQQVAAAIRRELIREGQVFFVHNRVATIEKAAEVLSKLVPEARIAIAHGQLPESALEQVVVDFWERKFDVLVCTTIIETGIDIPNANTLIIDRAEHFGLSQLHQIRGRVGRSRERAYAYFFYDPSKSLSETAHDRLATIAQNNELGAGIQVALKDLEIRGAGNLLGGEQSGHIAGVGFDLYLRMIGEAVSDFKGIKHESPAELKLEIPLDAHIPATYLDSERLRLEAYHKLSAASGAAATREQLDEILAELEDRYGKAPIQVRNLIEVTELRQIANSQELKDVNFLTGVARVQPVELTEFQQVSLSRTYPGLKYLQSAKLLQLPIPKDANGETVGGQELIDFAKEVFELVKGLRGEATNEQAR